MSSSTAFTDAWLRLQQRQDNAQPTLTHSKTSGDERYAKPTASSRSRAAINRSTADDPLLSRRKSIKEQKNLDHSTGLSKHSIYQAFAQTEQGRDPTVAKKPEAVAPSSSSGLPVRRKSVVDSSVRPQRQPRKDDDHKLTNRTKQETTSTTTKRTTHPNLSSGRPLTTKRASDAALARRRTLSGMEPQAMPRLQPTVGRSRQFSINDEEHWLALKRDTADTDDQHQSGTSSEHPPKKSGPNSPMSKTASPPTRESTKVILLADAFRDSLKAERTLARQDLGLATAQRKQQEKSGANRRSWKSATDPRRPSLAVDSPPTIRTTAEIINDTKRRQSLGKEKRREHEQTSATTNTTTHASTTNTTATTTTATTTAASTLNHATTTSTLKSAHATPREPRRRTLSTNAVRETSLEERRKSIASHVTRTVPENKTPTRVDRRRRSLAPDESRQEGAANSTAAASTASHVSAAAKQKQALGTKSRTPASRHNTPSSGDDDKQQTAPNTSRRASRVANTETTTERLVRQRKKSIVALDDSTLHTRRARRMSRTESLKEGVPTSPSRQAALAWRKKDQASQEATLKRLSKEAKLAVAVRKRGKSLPGSLATPPPVQSLNLPPMKLEPIRVTLPPASFHDKTPTELNSPRSPIPKSNISPTRSTTRSTNRSSATPLTGYGTSSEEESPRHIPSRKMANISALGVAPSGPTSLKSSLISPTSPKDANSVLLSPRNLPLSSRRPSASRSRKLSILTSNATKQSLVNDDTASVVGASTRTRKASTQSTRASSRTTSIYTGSRKSSIASVTDPESPLVEKDRLRVMSLQERLQAMVARHSIKDDFKTSEYSTLRDRRTWQTQAFDLDDMLGDDRSWMEGMRDKEIHDVAAAGIRGPTSPTTAITYCGDRLTPYEHTEIHEYNEIYFIGYHAQKHPATLDNAACNYGYDDERGDYQIVLQDHLAYRYEVLEVLGQGSFGQVVKCFDHKTGQTIAIKLIRNKKRFHAQALTEVKILQNLIDWDPHDQHHNIRMTDSFYFRNHLCIACECLSMNLYEFIKGNDYRGFSLSLIRRFTIQLLQSLCLLYEHEVIHCDLKPENILLKHPTKSTIKVIDFGSSCFESERVYTYIQSRFYRAPEIILGIAYTTAIDMWSLGCILAELYTGTPLFPGENEQEQLALIMYILGVPNQYIIDQSSRKKLFFDSSYNPRVIPTTRGKKRRPGQKTLSQALRCHDTLFLDFVGRCLEWDPVKRMKPDEALCHDWITQNSRNSALGKSK